MCLAYTSYAGISQYSIIYYDLNNLKTVIFSRTSLYKLCRVNKMFIFVQLLCDFSNALNATISYFRGFQGGDRSMSMKIFRRDILEILFFPEYYDITKEAHISLDIFYILSFTHTCRTSFFFQSYFS